MSSNNIPLKLLRGYKDNLPTAIEDGMIYYCIDSNELFFDYVNKSTNPFTEHRYCLNPMVGETDYGDPVGKGLVSPEDKEIIDTAVRFVEQQLEPEQQKQARLNIDAVGEKTLEGGEIFNDYENNVAFSYAHAEGLMNAATGEGSHAEGYKTIAAGFSAHSEGEGLGYTTLSSAATAGSNTFTVNNLDNFEIERYIVLNDEIKKITAIDSSTMTVTVDSNLSDYSAEGTVVYLSGAIGNYTHSEGNNTLASGKAAHAEGYRTLAVGTYSHARNYKAQALGKHSSAEGSNTVASGENSHAEGGWTESTGYGSHAEGELTIASGTMSHAEGEKTIASEYASHAEGSGTEASGRISHAEGYQTRAYGEVSHAEGYETEAYEKAHAEGYFSIAKGEGSHTEGYLTHAVGDYSHSEGKGLGHSTVVGNLSIGDITITVEDLVNLGEIESDLNNYIYLNNKAYEIDSIDTTNSSITIKEGLSEEINEGTYIYYSGSFGLISHTEGNGTIAIGKRSHAEGNHSRAIGNNSHAEGRKTLATGENSHAEGELTIASGTMSHAEGGLAIASGTMSHAEGENSIASGYISHAEGQQTMASGEASHAEGANVHVTGNYSHGEGINNKAVGSASHVEGAGSRAIGDTSHAEGYTKALGDHSHTEGFGNSFIRKITGEANATVYTLSSSLAGNYYGHGVLLYNNKFAIITDYDPDTLQITVENTVSSEALDNVNADICLGAGYGEFSHTEGYQNLAYGECQHVGGKYNIPDKTNAIIIGNGDEINRSNAHTLDWDGNAWFAGDVYIGGTSMDDATKLEAAKPYMTKITLTTSGWDTTALIQVVTIMGIKADETAQAIYINPVFNDTMIDEIGNCNVYASAQGENTITFSCDSIPTIDVEFYVKWQDVMWVNDPLTGIGVPNTSEPIPSAEGVEF